MCVFDGYCVQGPLWHNNQELRELRTKSYSKDLLQQKDTKQNYQSEKEHKVKFRGK